MEVSRPFGVSRGSDFWNPALSGVLVAVESSARPDAGGFGRFWWVGFGARTSCVATRAARDATYTVLFQRLGATAGCNNSWREVFTHCVPMHGAYAAQKGSCGAKSPSHGSTRTAGCNRCESPNRTPPLLHWSTAHARASSRRRRAAKNRSSKRVVSHR